MIGPSAEVVGIDLAGLERFVVAVLPQFAPPLTCRLFTAGRSNLTYLVTDAAGASFVVRRPPMGAVAPSANDLVREHRVLSALVRSAVPVPTPLALVSDPAVAGAPFLAMTFVDGEALDSAEAGAALSPSEARAATEALVGALVAIHDVDLDDVGLADLARHGGYLGRQVRRWRQQWDHVRTRDLPELDVLHDRLVAAVPDDSRVALVHGDYRFDNTLHARSDPTRIVAALDWEMSTLGDPLADLALLMGYWDGVGASLLAGGDPVAANPAFPSSAEVARLYFSFAGIDPVPLGFHRGLAYLKLAVIAEGLYQRHLGGAAVGEGFDAIGAAVPQLVAAGLHHLDHPDGPAHDDHSITQEEHRGR